VKKFEPKNFNIPPLTGISSKTVEEHLKLYEGYVKHSNLILDHIEELAKEAEKYAYELGELQRRFSFEFNGMRNHEYYFTALEGGPNALNDQATLRQAVTIEFGNFDKWLNRFKAVALTRGVGWAMLYYDKKNGRLLNSTLASSRAATSYWRLICGNIRMCLITSLPARKITWKIFSET
jgi:superoxide dismutase, Fe-Mn family